MKKLLLAVMVMCGLLIATPALASAQEPSSTEAAKKSLCDGVGLTGGNCDDPVSDAGIQGTIKLVINVLSWIVGLVAVIMIIIGGLKYITSAGDSNSINSAKNTILYAVVGLVVVALAQVLVQFVIKKASTPPVTAAGSVSYLEASKPDMV